MKRKSMVIIGCALVFAFIFGIVVSNIGVNSDDIEALKEQKVQLESEIEQLEAKRDGLLEEDNKKYIVTLKIKQTHLTIDLSEHFKDALNDIEIPIEVSEDFYNSVDKGDELNEDFRIGSFIFKGSIGSWKVTIKDKEIVEL